MPRTRDPARPAAARRHRRARACAANVPARSSATRCIAAIRARLTDARSRSRGRAGRKARQPRSRRWKLGVKSADRCATCAMRHRDSGRGAVARSTRAITRPLPAATATALATLSRTIADSGAAALRSRAARLSGIVPRHRVRARGAAARRAGRARAHLRSARSAPAAGRPRRARRAGRRHLAAGTAQRSLAQPADAAASSASICRSAASAFRRMISRRRSARRK